MLRLFKYLFIAIFFVAFLGITTHSHDDVHENERIHQACTLCLHVTHTIALDGLDSQDSELADIDLLYNQLPSIFVSPIISSQINFSCRSRAPPVV